MQFNKTTRFYFLIDGVKNYFKVAPIGWDEVEQDIKRSKTSDGIVLDITQNLKFVKDARQMLLDEYRKQGIDGNVKLVRQVKESNTWVTKSSGYVSFSTLTWDKTTATVDFVKNDFDAVFRDNFKEEFELDRTTDINGNDITALDREKLVHRSRKVFLRTEWEIDDQYTVSNTFSTDRLVTPKIKKTVSSDDDCVSVLRDLVINPTLSTDISAGATFNLQSSRNKTINITVNIDASFNNYDTARVQIYKYENGSDYDYVSTTNVSSVFSSGADVIYSGTVTIDVQEGQSLILGIYVDPGVHTTQVTFNSCSVTQTEDSFFDPVDPSERYVDCIGLFEAFTRITEILDPNVVFKSDYIFNNWIGLCITSGESIRHLYYKDEETQEETIAPLLTTSFEKLYNAMFTITPVAYGIRQEGNITILELEEIDYFFDSDEAVEIGNLSEITRSINEDKTYSRIEIGYNKSGKNEEVAGLYAVNTVNAYLLPANTIDNTYNATNDFRSDCNEVELCFRKQYSLFPDTDTQYDKDVFIFDCIKFYSTSQQEYLYKSYTYDIFFDDIYGVYDKETYYNVRLSPMNCLLRHGKNFKQEYMKDVYDTKKVQYSSTNGNANFTSTLIGESERPENGNVLITDLDDALYTNILIEGEGVSSNTIIDSINSGDPKANYLKTFVWIDEYGRTQKAFGYNIKIGEKIKYELVERYR